MPNETRDEAKARGETPPPVALDPHDVSLIEQNLRLTPEQRMEQLVRTVRFIQDARAALTRARG
jgi:hypothetical protein